MNRIVTVITLALLACSCKMTTPVTATNNPIGSKVGTSKNTCFAGGFLPSAGEDYNVISAGICTNKNYGALEAAKNSGIQRIATVDLKRTNYVFFSTYELIITGE